MFEGSDVCIRACPTSSWRDRLSASSQVVEFVFLSGVRRRKGGEAAAREL